MTQVLEYFSSLDNSVYSEQFGDVGLSKSSWRSERRHGMTTDKAISFAAVPDAVKRGTVIDIYSPEGKPGIERIVVAAPAMMRKQLAYVGAVLQRDARTQRLYLHDVVSKSNQGLQPLTQTRPDAKGSQVSRGQAHLDIFIILLNALGVNTDEKTRFSQFNGAKTNVGVVVILNNNGRPHGVNVGLQDGGIFKIDMKKAPEGPRSRVSRYSQGTDLPTSDASVDRISQNAEKSKTAFSIKDDSGTVFNLTAILSDSTVDRYLKATGSLDKLDTIFKVGDRIYEAEIPMLVTDCGRVFYDLTKLKTLPDAKSVKRITPPKRLIMSLQKYSSNRRKKQDRVFHEGPCRGGGRLNRAAQPQRRKAGKGSEHRRVSHAKYRSHKGFHSESCMISTQ